MEKKHNDNLYCCAFGDVLSRLKISFHCLFACTSSPGSFQTNLTCHDSVFMGQIMLPLWKVLKYRPKQCEDLRRRGCQYPSVFEPAPPISLILQLICCLIDLIISDGKHFCFSPFLPWERLRSLWLYVTHHCFIANYVDVSFFCSSWIKNTYLSASPPMFFVNEPHQHICQHRRWL